MGPRPSTVADEAWPAPDFAVMAGPAGACIAVHRVLLCLASSTLASAIEVQPAVAQLKLPDDDEAAWREVVTRLYQPFQANRGPGWSAHSVAMCLPLCHKYNIAGLLAECLAWCNSFALSPNPEDPHYVVKWMQLAERLHLDSLLHRCRCWLQAWPLSAMKGHPMYVLDWLVAAEKGGWSWLTAHCLQWLQPAHAASLHDAPASRLNVLQGLLADEEGCSKLSVPTLLALARIPISLTSSLDGAQPASWALACSNPQCSGRLALFGPQGTRSPPRAGGVPSLPPSTRRWEVASVPCPCGGIYTNTHHGQSHGGGAGGGSSGGSRIPSAAAPQA
ncbi:hypothetical protein QJQ45_013708, partial [Haematococcus lacustris]